MALRIKCPECDTTNRVDEDALGRRIRCKECDHRFRVPADLGADEERPRPKKKKPARTSHMLLYLVLGGTVLAVLLFTCVGGVGIVWIIHNANQPVDVARGKVIFDQGNDLRITDPRDPLQPQAHMKVHQVSMRAGKTYFIAMNTNAFDAYLRLEGPNGQNLAEDDDSGGALNALIVHRATQTGMHRVIATSLGGGVGAYRVIVQEAD